MAKKDVKSEANKNPKDKAQTKSSSKEKETEKEEVKVEPKDESKDESEKEAKDDIKEETTEPKDSEIIAEYKDRLLRAQAEFENFRKRSEKEKSDMFSRGVVSAIEKMLPVVDNFERGLDTADDSPFAEGIKMIYKQLMTALSDMGVKEIEAEGKAFDPNLHNAVMHEDDPEKGEQEVSEVLQKGYLYNDLVVRHAMVKVAN